MTDTTHQPKPEKKLPESTTSDSKAANHKPASARFVNGKIIPNRLTGLMIALVAVTLSVFGLLLYVQAVQQPQTAESEAQGMPPGAGEVGSVWLEATTSPDGTVAYVSVYASSETRVRQIVANINWRTNQAYYDIEVPAVQNPEFHCSTDGGKYFPRYNISYSTELVGGMSGLTFYGNALEYCNSINDGRSFDWSNAVPASDRILVGTFALRGRVDGPLELKLVFLTSIGNEYAASIGNPGNVRMTGTTVNIRAASTPPGTPTPLPTSATDRATHVLNSASGKSCDQLCAQQNMWCHSIGLKTEPITGTNEFMGLGGSYVYWDSGLSAEVPNKCKYANACNNGPPPIDGWTPEPNTNYCTRTFLDRSGQERPAGGPTRGCSAVMTNSDPYQACSNVGVPGGVGNEGDDETHRTPWTYCYCKSGPSPTPRTPIVLPPGPTSTPRPEVTPIVRASGSIPCECPLDYACTRDGQSCINLKTVYSDYDFSGTNRVSYTKYCTDGTLNKQCSENGPFKCTTYYTAYKPSGLHPSCVNCGCPSGKVCNPEITMSIGTAPNQHTVPIESAYRNTCTDVRVTCGDDQNPTSLKDQCLTQKPAYCQKQVFDEFGSNQNHNFVEIVPNCQKCGCPSGERCNADGTCGIEYSRVPGQKCEIWTGIVDGRYTGGVKCSGEFYVYPGYGSSSAFPTQPPRPYTPDPINPPIVTTSPGLPVIWPTIPIEMHATVAPGQPTAAPVPPALPSQTDVKSLEEFIEILRNPSLLESFISFLRLLGSLFGGASN